MWFFKKKKENKFEKGPALSCVHYGICSEKQCPMWVQLEENLIVEDKPTKVMTGKCSFAWTPQLLIELRNNLCHAVKTAQTEKDTVSQ